MLVVTPLPFFGKANPVGHYRLIGIETSTGSQLRIVLDDVGVIAAFYVKQFLLRQAAFGPLSENGTAMQ